MNSVSFEVGFTKRYRIYSMNSWVYLSSLHSADPFFSIKIMKNNSDYSILERFRISLKFALFYMLLVSFIFLLRGIESIIRHLDIIFVWSTIFSVFFGLFLCFGLLWLCGYSLNCEALWTLTDQEQDLKKFRIKVFEFHKRREKIQINFEPLICKIKIYCKKCEFLINLHHNKVYSAV